MDSEHWQQFNEGLRNGIQKALKEERNHTISELQAEVEKLERFDPDTHKDNWEADVRAVMLPDSIGDYLSRQDVLNLIQRLKQ